eukprot:scaffold57759_cov50-Attheya_sp.AAC.2
MNYAEDRLDRKARQSDLAFDQIWDSLIFPDGNNNDDDDDDDSVWQKHEAAGRALRDRGCCREAVFHYGMAWITCPNNSNWARAGDYAQMADLAGFPELGALALLYYRTGGALLLPLDVIISTSNSNHATKQDCGCGFALCSRAVPCFFPIAPDALHLNTILCSLVEFGDWIAEQNLERRQQGKKECLVSAASLLAILASRQRKRRLPEDRPTLDHQSLHGAAVTECPIYRNGHASNVLCFWDNMEGEGHARNIPSVVQLLLLKLLYTSPPYGCRQVFLQLACESVPYMSDTMFLEGKKLAQTHKSHWAYFVMIRAMVLGERVKLHRRGTAIPYHVPIWDQLRSVDHRNFPHDVETNVNSPVDTSNRDFVNEINTLIRECGSEKQIEPDVKRETQDSGNIRQSGRSHCCTPTMDALSDLSHPPLFVLGDSHVLSIGWQTIGFRNMDDWVLRTVVPMPATGLKAWHTRPETRFFTHSNLLTILERLPQNCKTIFLSAGEIDCREGIGGKLLEGYYQTCEDAVEHTVREYLIAVEALALRFGLQILLLPVAPHAYRSEKNGKSTGRALRRERMLFWNEQLRSKVQNYKDVFLLDYEKELRTLDPTSPVGFVLNKSYNADFTHMNSAFLPLLEDAIEKCGCNLNLI